MPTTELTHISNFRVLPRVLSEFGSPGVPATSPVPLATLKRVKMRSGLFHPKNIKRPRIREPSSNDTCDDGGYFSPRPYRGLAQKNGSEHDNLLVKNTIIKTTYERTQQTPELISYDDHVCVISMACDE